MFVHLFFYNGRRFDLSECHGKLRKGKVETAHGNREFPSTSLWTMAVTAEATATAVGGRGSARENVEKTARVQPIPLSSLSLSLCVRIIKMFSMHLKMLFQARHAAACGTGRIEAASVSRQEQKKVSNGKIKGQKGRRICETNATLDFTLSTRKVHTKICGTVAHP